MADAWWRVVEAAVIVGDRRMRLVAAINEATAEVKYFVTNAENEPLRVVMAVAFRRATVEHAFCVAKNEAGLTHYEGRQYTGLMRHLILVLIVMGFVSIHTDRLRGEKPGGDARTGVPGAECSVRGAAVETPGDVGGGSNGLIIRYHQRPNVEARVSHSKRRQRCNL